MQSKLSGRAKREWIKCAKDCVEQRGLSMDKVNKLVHDGSAWFVLSSLVC